MTGRAAAGRAFLDKRVASTPALQEDLAMGDRTPAGDADNEHGHGPDAADDDEIAAKMRAVMRAQEIHREGGIDPDLEVGDADPDPDA
jgi:hypothetical protein